MENPRSKFYEISVTDGNHYTQVSFWSRQKKENAYICLGVSGNILTDMQSMIKDALYEIVKRGVRPSPLLLGELERSFKALYDLKSAPTRQFIEKMGQAFKEMNGLDQP